MGFYTCGVVLAPTIFLLLQGVGLAKAFQFPDYSAPYGFHPYSKSVLLSRKVPTTSTNKPFDPFGFEEEGSVSFNKMPSENRKLFPFPFLSSSQSLVQEEKQWRHDFPLGSKSKFSPKVTTLAPTPAKAPSDSEDREMNPFSIFSLMDKIMEQSRQEKEQSRFSGAIAQKKNNVGGTQRHRFSVRKASTTPPPRVEPKSRLRTAPLSSVSSSVSQNHPVLIFISLIKPVPKKSQILPPIQDEQEEMNSFLEELFPLPLQRSSSFEALPNFDPMHMKGSRFPFSMPTKRPNSNPKPSKISRRKSIFSPFVPPSLEDFPSFPFHHHFTQDMPQDQDYTHFEHLGHYGHESLPKVQKIQKIQKLRSTQEPISHHLSVFQSQPFVIPFPDSGENREYH